MSSFIEALRSEIDELEAQEEKYLRLANKARQQREKLIVILHEREIDDLEPHPTENKFKSFGSVTMSAEKLSLPNSTDTITFLKTTGKEIKDVIDSDFLDRFTINYLSGRLQLDREKVMQVLQCFENVYWKRSTTDSFTWENLNKKAKSLEEETIKKQDSASFIALHPNQEKFKKRLPAHDVVKNSRTIVEFLNTVFLKHPNQALRVQDILEFLYPEQTQVWTRKEKNLFYKIISQGLSVHLNKGNWIRVEKGLYQYKN